MPQADLAEKEGLEAQAIQYQSIYAELLTSYENTRLAETQASANIIQLNKAVPPEKPIRPKVMLNVAIAGVAVGLLAAGIVLLVNYLDNTISTPEQIEQLLGLPVLGVIFKHNNNNNVISQASPMSPTSEAFRSLRTNVMFYNTEKKMKTILVTSAGTGSGKSLVSSNLAVVMASAGEKVTLVDVDLRRPSIHKYFKLPNDLGISNWFLDKVLTFKKLIHATKTDNLVIITSGDLPPNPAELFGSDRMDEILKSVQEKSDVIIMDAPPVLPVADALVLATKADGVLLVFQPGKTTIMAVRQAVRGLKRVNAHILGVVFNNVKTRGSLYNYYYRDGYGSSDSSYYD